MDVSVIAQGERKGFAWEKDSMTLGAANFVVAVYQDQDREAESSARAIAESEYAVRQLAAKHHASETELHSLPSVLRHVAFRLDPEHDSSQGENWLRRLLTGRADPHLDKEIRRLPMSLRVAVLEYAERRDRFLAINDRDPSATIEQIADNETTRPSQP